jgi:hypothetical protein
MSAKSRSSGKSQQRMVQVPASVLRGYASILRAEAAVANCGLVIKANALREIANGLMNYMLIAENQPHSTSRKTGGPRAAKTRAGKSGTSPKRSLPVALRIALATEARQLGRRLGSSPSRARKA